MEKLIAVHTIGLGGKYITPGSAFEVEPDEAVRLVSLRAARRPGAETGVVSTAVPEPVHTEEDDEIPEPTDNVAPGGRNKATTKQR